MSLVERTDTVSVSDGEVSAWIDGGIHLKATTPSGDPVELSAEEAKLVIDGLVRLVAALEAE
jgi:hypothetical protein